LGSLQNEISSFFVPIFLKMGLEIGTYQQMKYLKASDAFILPYKYNAQISNIEIYDGEFFPKPHKKF